MFYVFKIKGVHSPSRGFYLLTLFMMEFPDLDHFYHREIQPQYVVPFTIWDIFKWSLRTEIAPSHILHYWIYPFTLLILLALPADRMQSYRWWIFGAMLGWATHLLLDGVIYFI